MVLIYKRSELKENNQNKVAKIVEFSTLSKKKKHEINKLLAKITTQ